MKKRSFGRRNAPVYSSSAKSMWSDPPDLAGCCVLHKSLVYDADKYQNSYCVLSRRQPKQLPRHMPRTRPAHAVAPGFQRKRPRVLFLAYHDRRTAATPATLFWRQIHGGVSFELRCCKVNAPKFGTQLAALQITTNCCYSKW